MNRPVTRESYARRLNRVAEHIWAHLDAPLDLAQLAEVACLSPFHFHRIYRAMIGETVAETVSRLRLQRASMELARGPGADRGRSPSAPATPRTRPSPAPSAPPMTRRPPPFERRGAEIREPTP